jgi:dsRNA-specific ribonuclease
MNVLLSNRWLAAQLGCADKHNELKKALTHKSFFKNEDSEQSNSRYVFAGMFGFKGKVAETLFNYMPGSGTQLQHYLGNIFKEDTLLKIYKTYHLDVLCRYGTTFDIEKQKHILVYGFLGFICQWLSPEKLNQFIVLNFLAETSHLMPTQFKNQDLQNQCNYFCRLTYQENVSVNTQLIDEILF